MRFSAAIFLLVLIVQLAEAQVGPSRDAFVATQDPLGEPVSKVVYLEQNWSPAESVQFYFTEQGSQIIPYDWFLALEQVDSGKAVSRQSEHSQVSVSSSEPRHEEPGRAAGRVRRRQGAGPEVAGDDVRGLPYE